MTDRWFDDIPEHDPDDPDAVARALRRQERAADRGGKGAGASDGEAPQGRTALSLPNSRSRKPGKRGGSDGPHYGRLALVGGAAVVGLIVVWLFFSIFQPFHGDGTGEPFKVNIPEGGVKQVANVLADRGVISNPTMFQIRATITGKRSNIYHGSHTFKKDMSYGAALDELGKQPSKVTVNVVLPEGLSRSQMAGTVEQAGLPGDYQADSVKSPLLNPNDYGAAGKAKSLEGFLWPATYQLKPGSDAQDLVDQQLQAFKDNIASVNMKYAKKKNLTVYDIVTIASMIEREASVPSDRAKVAEVIYNRLKQGIPLGIDATTRYALNNWTKPLTESDLAVDSPYNTRTNQGLPPGPIGSPGLASLQAAAHPGQGGLLYYVVKPGSCNELTFSKTYAQFQKDAAAYQQALAAKGSSPTSC